MPAHSEKRIFTYQTRVTLTPDQERALADYAALFCRVERTLHADLQSFTKPAESACALARESSSIIEAALATRKPVVVERLEFSKKESGARK